ncbi:MAG: polysaccharide deacetylase family protein [Vicinamibacterales bacterium]
MNALMYHDVVAAGDENSSGFPGRDAALYKVTPEVFEEHLDAIERMLSTRGVIAACPAPVTHSANPASPAPVVTFDDGGSGAMTAAAMLERRGWMGHFFVTTNYIGRRGFLGEQEISDLARRGHVIGSHSCSHPLRMGHCAWPQLLEEWSRSRSILAGIIGADVCEASVPGGDFAPQLAAAAAKAGITRLFTSEPTGEARYAFGLTLVGRFAVQRWTGAETAAALAAGDWGPCARQAVIWSAKKMTKRLGGQRYLQIRRLLLRHGDDVQWGDTKG